MGVDDCRRLVAMALQVAFWLFLHLFPFWMRYFFPRFLDSALDRPLSRDGRKSFFRDVRILLNLPSRVTPNFIVSVLGYPNSDHKNASILIRWLLNLFGTAPDTELTPTLRMMLEGTKIFVLGFIGTFTLFLSCIPVVCVVVPIWQWISVLLNPVAWPWTSKRGQKEGMDTFLLRSNECQHVVDDEDSESEWFYVNGVANTLYIAQAGCHRMNDLFEVADNGRRRPPHPTLLYNPTDGVINDLFECLLGRTFHWPSIPAQLFYIDVLRALKKTNLKKVVLVGHSQGTIILDNVVHLLITLRDQNGLTDAHFAKLEVYMFAAACDHVYNPDEMVHVEYFANHHDLVAQFGILAPELHHSKYTKSHTFYNADRTGHILNEHYLNKFEEQPYAGPDKKIKSRLYGYLKVKRKEE
eukprot:TRINITY_DN3876_c0_g1_i2.p1 TRINITY_DN3876_c0_g1~~TRINITY_DN3876_c0_g1_i2.p1  ORF type:complete len:411 (+),score=94.79 TRINITY_DN3876_c0_g1_i2:172-1404(+)